MTIFSRLNAVTAVAATSLMLGLSTASATEFKIAVGDGGGGTQEALGKAFIAALEQHTSGNHTGSLFLNGQLGDEQATVNDLSMGTLDFSILAITLHRFHPRSAR